MGHDRAKYPLERILVAAELASNLQSGAVPELTKAFEDSDSAVRYWAALGLLMRGKPAVQAAHGSLQAALADPSPYVRVTAAEALAQFGDADDAPLALKVLGDHSDWSHNNVFTAISALNAVEHLGPSGEPIKKSCASHPRNGAASAVSELRRSIARRTARLGRRKTKGRSHGRIAHCHGCSRG